MGKGGAKVEVTEYFMSIHFGICAKVDRFKRVVIKEKDAWSGSVTSLQSIPIAQRQLFGGNKKEGGVDGTICFLPGDDDQVLPDELAQRLGRSGGTDAPGYRGIATAWFYGGGLRGNAGFYWTANNPYLPGVWIECERAPKGLNPAYAMIARPGTSEFPLETDATTSVFGNFAFAPDHRTFFMTDQGGYPYELWDVETRAIIATGTMPANMISGQTTGIDSAGRVWYLSSSGGVAGFSSFDPVTGIVSAGEALSYAPFIMLGTQVIADEVYMRPFVSSTAVRRGAASISTSISITMFFGDPDGNHWAIGRASSTEFGLQCVFGPRLGENYTTTMLGGETLASGDNVFGVHNGQDFVVKAGSRLYKLDGASLATIDDNVIAVTDFVSAWTSLEIGAQFLYSGGQQISLVTLDLMRDVGSYFTSGVDRAVYSPMNNALLGARFSSTTILDWLLLDRGEGDANPAHIIFESLINTDWGMGSPETAIDVDGFEAAAVVLHGEGFGLSMIWTRQASVEKFIQEVLDHIQAVLFVDPATGLLTLKLIRADYDEETLPELTPDNADLLSFGRKIWGEIVNEIVVTWTNPTNEQDETVTVQDLASIVIQGGIISDGRNYYGVRSSQLAAKLAARDLRTSGAPLAAVEAEVDRTLWAIRPASVVKIVWPEYGLAGVVMRVMSVDYGKPGDPKIRLSLLEDVFGLDAGDYVEPPSSSWEDLSSRPAALEIQRAFTLPYFLAAAATTSSPTYPEVLAGVLGSTSDADTFNFELWDQVAQPDGSLEWQSLTTMTLLGHATLQADLVPEASSIVSSFGTIIGKTSPTQGSFVLIGDDGEDINELALVTGASGGYTLARGVLDTVPRDWPLGTPVWFLSGASIFEDPTTRSAGEDVSYKLLTRTSQGLLPLGMAPMLTETLTERPWLPSRPANVVAFGEAFSTADAPIDATGRADPWVTVTWANRNRLLEDSQVLGWTDATVSPETGQTTKIEVLDEAGLTVIATHDGLTGTSFDVPDASFGSSASVIIRVSAERSDAGGTFESLQSFDHYVTLDGPLDPLTLSPTAWYDPSDLSTMFEDTAGTTPASVDGLVGRLEDKSGNGNHLLLPSGAGPSSRPVLKKAGSLYYLQFSNINSTLLEAAGLTMTQPDDIALAGRYDSALGGRHFFDGITSRQAMLDSSGDISLFAGGSVVGGAAIAADTDYVFVARFDGGSSIIRTNGVTSSAINPGTNGLGGLRVGAYAPGSGQMTGRIYGIIMRDTIFSPEELGDVEAYLAGKAGITL